MPSLSRVAAPSVEPVTLTDLKTYLRVDDTAEDAELSSMISEARDWIEARTGRRLITQQWLWVVDLAWHRQGILSADYDEEARIPERYADKMIRSGLFIQHQPSLRFPIAPVQAVEAFTYRIGGQDVAYPDLANVRTTHEGQIIFDPYALPPLPDEQVGALSITCTVGYGPAAADVPERYLRAIKLLCAHWYENRALYVMPQGAGRIVPGEMVAGISDLLRQERRLGL